MDGFITIECVIELEDEVEQSAASHGKGLVSKYR
jgi:hypothetical protein